MFQSKTKCQAGPKFYMFQKCFAVLMTIIGENLFFCENLIWGKINLKTSCWPSSLPFHRFLGKFLKPTTLEFRLSYKIYSKWIRWSFNCNISFIFCRFLVSKWNNIPNSCEICESMLLVEPLKTFPRREDYLCIVSRNITFISSKT